MDQPMTQDGLNDKIRERFKELPVVVQKAIMSADVQKQLRELADTNKPHLHQWQALENEVMLTLLGFQAPEDLPENLRDDLEVSEATARELTENISKIVFAPIRAELEREVATPRSVGTQTAEKSPGVDQVPASNDAQAKPEVPAPP